MAVAGTSVWSQFFLKDGEVQEKPKTAIQCKKEDYRERLLEYLREYKKCIIVDADNVTSNQLHRVRAHIRGRAVMLMGKNTQIRAAIAEYVEETGETQLRDLVRLVQNNVGLVFTNESLLEIRELLLKETIGAPAKAGAMAPKTVVVPAQNTGLEPKETSFFQALNIPTKITKGTVEIMQDVVVITEGTRVGSSEAALLNKLGIKPFTYGLQVRAIYDEGSTYENWVLDLQDEDFAQWFASGVEEIASISLAINYPTIASVPHSILNGYKNVLSIAVATNIDFPLARQVKDILENPDAFIAAAVVQQDEPKNSSAPVAAPADDSDEESDDGEMFSLFD